MKVKMKKTIILFTVALMLVNSQSVFSHQRVTSELAPLIKMYKAGNYTECYKKLTLLSKKDSSNAILYYYLGMSASQLGKNEEAIDYYSKSASLAEPSSNLYRYAQRGKACAEGLPACAEEDNETLSVEDMFIKSQLGTFSEKARGEYERLKLENMMREINRTRDVDPSQFRDFKDFSGMENSAPVSEQEMLAAYEKLQKAGITNFLNGNMSDILLLSNDKDYSDKSRFQDMSDISPEYIQMLMMNNF